MYVFAITILSLINNQCIEGCIYLSSPLKQILCTEVCLQRCCITFNVFCGVSIANNNFVHAQYGTFNIFFAGEVTHSRLGGGGSLHPDSVGEMFECARRVAMSLNSALQHTLQHEAKTKVKPIGFLKQHWQFCILDVRVLYGLNVFLDHVTDCVWDQDNKVMFWSLKKESVCAQMCLFYE